MWNNRSRHCEEQPAVHCNLKCELISIYSIAECEVDSSNTHDTRIIERLTVRWRRQLLLISHLFRNTWIIIEQKKNEWWYFHNLLKIYSNIWSWSLCDRFNWIRMDQLSKFMNSLIQKINNFSIRTRRKYRNCLCHRWSPGWTKNSVHIRQRDRRFCS